MTRTGVRLVLFDIDGTLLHSSGAGMRAFCDAFREVFGIAVETGSVRPDGKTDPIIVREMLACHGVGDLWTPQAEERLFTLYLAALPAEIEKSRVSGGYHSIPGAGELLAELSTQPEFALGLVTGNLETGARIKLQAAGLWEFFRFGGFASDSADRTVLIRVGIERGRSHVAPTPVDAIFVVGDTPLDITHGRAAGARTIAVGSGRFTVEDLRPHEPDYLIRDLTPTADLLAYLARG
jgi:phosphoglycolate phosphatase